MVTKRKPPLEYPVQATRKLVDKIRKELSCTEAEAYFTLRYSLHPQDIHYDPDHKLENPQPTLEWAIAHTRNILKSSNECRVEVEKGETMRLLEAVQFCGELGFPLPKWATERVERALESYNFYIAKTLDEAFKIKKRPRNFPLKKASEAANLSFNIYLRCKNLHEEGVKIGGKDKDLFEEVASEFNLGRTVVSEYYYFWFEKIHSMGWLSVPELIEPLLRSRARKKGRSK